ncbi:MULTISPECIES: hypothetical protein [Delftia]|jgi:hypothetical protein|uniref:hypothetical protein n=1 Tax=Delftia TaxID=80865 RepID=UPI00233F0C92|nr:MULTISPECIES: hypothetical protein [Delftia]MDC2862192.1 hypothetical protein [Delftia sp. DT-2]
MTLHDDKTAQGWPLPHPDNRLEDDVLRLRQAVQLIDAASVSMGLLLDTKASKAALQVLDQFTTQSVDSAKQKASQELATAVQQLQQQLATLDGKIDKKKMDLVSVVNASTSQEVFNGMTRVQQLMQAHSSYANNGVPLVAGIEYSLYTAEVYSRPLPTYPTVGDTIVLVDPWGFWERGNFTLRRGNAAHVINNVYEDVVFNANVWRVTLHYSWANYWTLSIG